MKRLFDLALEGMAETTQKPETEIVVYARIGSMEGLEQCVRKERQDQLEAQFKNSLNCRVRHYVDDDKYVFTFKVKTKNQEGLEANNEYNATVDKDFYEGFKSAASRYLKKTRYYFSSEKVVLTMQRNDEKVIVEIPNIEYEVDVYEKEDGQPSEYCKIDIEADNIINFITTRYPDIEGFKLFVKVSHLPFQPQECIHEFKNNPDLKKQVDLIWDQFIREVPKPGDQTINPEEPVQS